MPFDNTGLLERFARLEAYNEAFRAVQHLLLGRADSSTSPFQAAEAIPVNLELLRLYARRRAEIDVFRMALGAASMEAILYEQFYVRSFLAGVYQDLAEALLEVEQGLLPLEVQARAEAVLAVIEAAISKGASSSQANDN